MENNIIIKRGDKKLIRAWVMYDWSNSVFQLTIATAIFPLYYNEVTRHGNDFIVSFFGYNIINTVLYSWSIAFACLLVAILSPLLSSIADYTGRRKAFMKIFTYLGALACSGLFFFDAHTIEWGIICFTLGTIGYGGSLVFYNSFLPVIAEPDDQDRISANGYSMGYLGGVALLILNLIVLFFPSFFGISEPALAARISFLTVCIWWIGFSQITFSKLPKYTFGNKKPGVNPLTGGYQEFRNVFKCIIKIRLLSIYLVGYFFMIMGVLSVMYMAASFGEKEMKLKVDVLIPVILLIQLVGMFGAWFFSKLSKKIGNLKSLIISLICWVFICVGAYMMTDVIGFICVAFCVGIVMGGTQSLARSTYSKMIPETKDHTSYFSFYDVMEKLATVGGLFSFGFIEMLTGNMRSSILAVIVFFIIALFFLILTIVVQKKSADGNQNV